MKKDRLYDVLETTKKNPLKAVLSHFGALSDHSALALWAMFPHGPCLATIGLFFFSTEQRDFLDLGQMDRGTDGPMDI